MREAVAQMAGFRLTVTGSLKPNQEQIRSIRSVR